MPVIIADPHFHNWADCSKIEDGMNSRLKQTLEATTEAFEYALKKDKAVVIAGDLFHTRGAIVPSVFNCVHQLIEDYAKQGLRFYILAGNHDSEDINAIAGHTAVDSFTQCGVVSEGHNVFDCDGNRFWLYAWKNDINELVEQLKQDNLLYSANDTVFIHAPISGFAPKFTNCIDRDFLLSLNCKKIFAGHIHLFGSYKQKVYSVGSLTQQNFGDMGKKLGFLYYDIKNDMVTQIETKAPHFLDLNNIVRVPNDLSFKTEVAKSFVRVTLENVSEDKKKFIESSLKAMKPKMLNVRYTAKMHTVRSEVLKEAGLTGKEATATYIDKQEFEYKEDTKQQAMKILDDMENYNE